MIYTEYEYIKYTEICKGASRIYVQGGLTKKFFLHHHLIQYLPNTDDNHIVTVRPKFYIGSTGTVWANETMFLRYTFPHQFKVESNLNHVKGRATTRQISHRTVIRSSLLADWLACRVGGESVTVVASATRAVVYKQACLPRAAAAAAVNVRAVYAGMHAACLEEGEWAVTNLLRYSQGNIQQCLSS